jgi:hypothetical protein
MKQNEAGKIFKIFWPRQSDYRQRRAGWRVRQAQGRQTSVPEGKAAWLERQSWSQPGWRGSHSDRLDRPSCRLTGWNGRQVG